MTVSFTSQPQRSDGRAYVPCEPHQATSWAVVKTEKFTSRGIKREVSRVITRCKTKTEADGMVQSNNRSFAPKPRSEVRQLGRRIIQ